MAGAAGFVSWFQQSGRGSWWGYGAVADRDDEEDEEREDQRRFEVFELCCA